MRPRFRFAPESRAPTTLLELATVYFWLNGVLYALSFVFFLLFMLGAVFFAKFHGPDGIRICEWIYTRVVGAESYHLDRDLARPHKG